MKGVAQEPGRKPKIKDAFIEVQQLLFQWGPGISDLISIWLGSNRVGVIAQSGVLASESSGDQIDFCYLNTVFELYSSYHFGQVVEAA